MKQGSKSRGGSAAQGVGAVTQTPLGRNEPVRPGMVLNGSPSLPGNQFSADSRAQAPSRDDIVRRAYEIYLARAGRPGSPEQDWLQAERELGARTLAGRNIGL